MTTQAAMRAAILAPPSLDLMAVDPLPHDVAAESAVLGGVFKRPSLLDTLALHPEDFYVLRNQHAYRAFLAQYASGGDWHLWPLAERMAASFSATVTPMPVRTALIHLAALDVEWFAWHVPLAAARVRDCAQRRALMLAAQRVWEQASDPRTPLDTTRTAEALTRTARPPAVFTV